MKKSKEKISMLTGYDFPFALMEEKAGIEIILVGDSLGMTVLGYASTLPVTMDIMIPHAKAVKDAAPNAFVIGDLPYMTYQISKEEAVRNAGRYMQEAGVDGVKLEGGKNVLETVKAIVSATIPVMGHLGLTPQSVSQLSGFKAQGRDLDSALELIEDAKALEEAGVFSILLEAIPSEVAEIIAQNAKIPVISLGSGPDCDGSCLIVHDMLGFFEKFQPKFVKQYLNLNEVLTSVFEKFRQDVKSGTYPETHHGYQMKRGEKEKLLEYLSNQKKS